MTTTQTLEATKALLTAEIEIAFIQRTDSEAKNLLWKIKVQALDSLVAQIKLAA